MKMENENMCIIFRNVQTEGIMENQDIPQPISVSELLCLITLFNETQSRLHLPLLRLETIDISVERTEGCGFIISQFEKKW